MPDFLPGIKTTHSNKQWIRFNGPVYHDSGKIYVSARLGGDAGKSNNNYDLSHQDVDFMLYERVTGSTGAGIGRSISPDRIDEVSVNGVGIVEVTLIFGKDQKVKQSDGQHEYHIKATGTDSHGGGHYSNIKWIPSPPPPSGPIVVLENKSGHFLSSGNVELHVNIFTNPCSGDNANATHIMSSVDGGAWANSNTFPHIETISGIGSHTFKVKGCANTIVGQEISYSFSIGDNDWSNTHLTPVKTIRHTGKEGSFVNFFTNNATPNAPTPSKGFLNFDDVFGGGNCYYSNTRILNANTQEIIGEGSSTNNFKLEPRSLFNQTDASNTFVETYFGGEPDTNTFVKFSDVCYKPKASVLEYFRSTRTPDFEVQLLAISYDQLTIWDECSTPLPTVQEQSIASSPNSDGKYEFTRSGLWANMRVIEIDHPIPEQYYKLTTSNTVTGTISSESFGFLAADTTETVLFSPNRSDNQMTLDIFNSCGGTVTQTFDLLYIGSVGGTGTIGQGQGPGGSLATVSTIGTSGDRPTYHRLIVNSLNE